MRSRKCLTLQTLLIVLCTFAACTKPNDTNLTDNQGNTGNPRSSDSTITTPPGVRLTLADTLKMFSGWWYPEDPAYIGYKKVYFGPDSTMFYGSDLSGNTMDGYAALWWPIRDTCMIYYQWGGFPILKLTKDTLIMSVLGKRSVFSKYDTSLITSKPMFTIAGNGIGYGPVTGAAMSVGLGALNIMAVDAQGNIFMTEGDYIKKLDNNGTISVFAGAIPGSDADGVPATSVAFHYVRDLAFDKAGNMYYADYGRNAVRMISAANGTVSTITGGNVQGAFSGDGGPAAAASLNGPVSIAIDASDNIYVADMNNYRIRKINAADKIINTVAGTGVNKTDGDGGLAINAGVQPAVIRFDANQNLFISGSGLIRKIAGGTGIITWVAGAGSSGERGEDAVATKAFLNNVQGLAIDKAGNIYLSEKGASRVRRIDAVDGKIRTVAGKGYASFGYEYHKHATLSSLNAPAGITFTNDGNLLIADVSNYRMRKLICN